MEHKLEYEVRKATINDMEYVRDMIQELADYEKMSNGPKLTTQDLIKDSGLSDCNQSEYFHCYVIEIKNNSQLEDNSLRISKPIGYSICFFTYSTWNGKTYFIEDIYIKPAYRSLGAGKKLFEEIIKIAKNFECSRIDFHVLSWNPARKFYEKFGAINLTETENWNFYRLEKNIIDKY